MLEIPSLSLKYSELQNDRRLGIRFRYVSVLQIVKENYCTKTRTNSTCLFNLPWMFAMVKRKLIVCIHTIIQAKDRSYGSIYLLIVFNEFNYPLTMFATTLSYNKLGSCLYRVLFFLHSGINLLALKFYLKHLHKQCKLKLNKRLIFECHTLEGKILSRLLPQTTWEKKDSCLETILSYTLQERWPVNAVHMNYEILLLARPTSSLPRKSNARLAGLILGQPLCGAKLQSNPRGMPSPPRGGSWLFWNWMVRNTKILGKEPRYTKPH